MKGSLILANGEKFTGEWIGEKKDVMGELICFTGMSRFQEFITDPANHGKIVAASFPGILNSDLDKNRFESEQIQISGLITQQDASIAFLKGDCNLQSVFAEQNVPILSQADTRAIIKRIKTIGETPAVLATEPAGNRLPPGKEWNPNARKVFPLSKQGTKHVVIIDFGHKKSLIQQLADKGLKITIVSCVSNAGLIDSLQPDGIIFSGGPGNPSRWQKYFPEYKKIAGSYPTIGFGLGHQVLALAFGAAADKLSSGHRNFKEAVIHIKSNKIFMSCQNHEYVISEKSIGPCGLKISFRNALDGTIEGLVHEKLPLATYQFHPEQIENPLMDFIFQPFFQYVFESKGESIYA